MKKKKGKQMARDDKRLDHFFDSDWYLEQYPEVKKLIDQGQLNSALTHYLTIGVTEKKSPHSGFDESYYLEANEDIRDAITQGEYKCGYHHYLKYGEEEGRPPRQITREEIDSKNAMIEILNETMDLDFLK